MSDSKTIGLRLKLERIKNGYTIKTVAKKCNISPTSLYSYEAGTRSAKDSVKVKLASLYNSTVQALFFDEEIK